MTRRKKAKKPVLSQGEHWLLDAERKGEIRELHAIADAEDALAEGDKD